MCYTGNYQDGVDDPLSVPEQCELDASLMKNLLVNTIRVYSVNNDLSHDQCMKIFEEHGIYVVISLDTPMATIYRVSRWHSPVDDENNWPSRLWVGSEASWVANT